MSITNRIITSIVLLLMFSCNPNTIFEKNITIPQGIWNKNNIIKLDVEIKDNSIPFDIYINIRNTELYQYGNIWLFIKSISPDGLTQKDTFNCILADESGKWLGDGAGDIWDNTVLFKKNVMLKQTGVYKFEIEQGMRAENLPFIMDAGIRIDKIKIDKKN